MSSERYRDPALPVEDRAEDLLARMTLEEKAAELTALWLDFDPATGAVSPFEFGMTDRPGTDIYVALAHGIGHLSRPFGTRPLELADGLRNVNGLQRRLVEGTRLGVPAICHEECLSGFMAYGATAFPCPLNLASTWDPGLVEAMTAVIRRQMRSAGTHQGLAPVADIARDARWGRVEETLGEDPYLAGTMVSAYVRGLQGDDLRDGVVATLKHFAGYSFSEGGRNFAPVHLGRRELADFFLVPFEMAIRDAGALGVMPAYVAVDGEPAHASRWLLTEVLREWWGFEGAVVADYGGVSFLRTQHRVAADRAAAVATALNAGLDVELPQPAEMIEGVREALERGLLDIATVDEAVRRVLRLKFRLGLFEQPYADTGLRELQVASDKDLAREIATRSVTLLSNNGILPLDPSERVVVLGPNAADPLALFGNYSFANHVVSAHHPDQVGRTVTSPTVLDALKERLGQKVSYARGATVLEHDRSGIGKAVKLARGAGAALVVLGDRAGHFGRGTVGEGTDTADLGLPGSQGELLDAVLDTGTPVILVLLNGRPFDLHTVSTRCAAIVEAWFPGQEGAAAIADVLTGEASPSGRSPLTFSRGAGTQPRYYNHPSLARGVPAQAEFDPVFPFGHGLTYTTFEYGDLRLSDSVTTDGEIEVSCTITNVGRRAGDEVVQVYVRDLDAAVTRPVRQLVAFCRVPLEAGEVSTVEFRVPVDLLSYTGPDYKRIIEPGPVEVMVGASVEDIRLRGEVALAGETRRLDGARRLTSSTKVVNLGPSSPG